MPQVFLGFESKLKYSRKQISSFSQVFCPLLFLGYTALPRFFKYHCFVLLLFTFPTNSTNMCHGITVSLFQLLWFSFCYLASPFIFIYSSYMPRPFPVCFHHRNTYVFKLYFLPYQFQSFLVFCITSSGSISTFVFLVCPESISDYYIFSVYKLYISL